MNENNLKELIKQLIIMQEAPNRLPNRGRPPKRLANALKAINNAPFEPEQDGSGNKQQQSPAGEQEDKRLNFQKPIDPDYQSGKFNLEQYMNLPTPGDRLKYARAAAERKPGSFRRLGEGSSRAAYSMPGTGKVLKLAMNNAGIDQNKEEIEITRKVHQKMPEYPIVTKIYGHDSSSTPTWLISEEVKPYMGEVYQGLDFDQILRIIWSGGPQDLIDSYSRNLRNLSMDPRNVELTKKALEVLRNPSPFIKALGKVISTGMDAGDLEIEEHWGLTEDGRLVILDYGYANKVVGNYRDARRNAPGGDDNRSPYFKKFAEAYRQELK